MPVNREVPRGSTRRAMSGSMVVAAAAIALVLAPGTAAGAVPVHTQTLDAGAVTVQGYEVKQSFLGAPHPEVDGYITKMSVDVVDADGTPVPIQRLMLHHIVFANASRPDTTCQNITGFDGYLNPGLARERFYAAGEERAEMELPPGYGYRLKKNDFWGLLYMFMNHRATTDTAHIQYTVEYVTDADLAAAGETIEPVTPYWLDVNNCRADPIYNVPGTGGPGSTHTRSYDFTMPRSGRIVGGSGHVHGGARELSLSQPSCDNRLIAQSLPTWGLADHPFYNVRPILHEPGPINMTAWTSTTGVPVAAGQTLRLDSVYDNSVQHTRVMGISVIYVSPDNSVTPAEGCGPLPTDLTNLGTDQPGRAGPIVPYRIPLTGLDSAGNAVTIKNPPGKLIKKPSGSTLYVGDHFFVDRNVKVKRGAQLTWNFGTEDLHNVTTASGPVGLGSENLNGDRTFSYEFRKKGTYRFFCALHPVDMTERVVVVGKNGKRKRP